MTDLVKLIDGKAVTTSRKVAEIFEKEHCKVLRSIRELETPKKFNEANFGLVEYIDQKGEKRPEYLITRDGFTILAMGFTGKKAMQFKIAYIEAFNAMEEELNRQTISRPVNIVVSTAELIEKINLQLIADMEVEPEVLRYAWNIGRLIGKTIQKPVSSELEEFIMGLSSGRFSRKEIYDMYCASCSCPVSAKKFWPAVRAVRPCDEIRQAYCRYVVFK